MQQTVLPYVTPFGNSSYLRLQTLDEDILYYSINRRILVRLYILHSTYFKMVFNKFRH